MFKKHHLLKTPALEANCHGSIQNRSHTPIGLYKAKYPRAWGQLICTRWPMVLRVGSGQPIIETKKKKKVFAVWCCWLLESGTQTKQCGHNGWRPGQGRRGQMASSSGTLWCLFTASKTVNEAGEQWPWKYEEIKLYMYVCGVWYGDKEILEQW